MLKPTMQAVPMRPSSWSHRRGEKIDESPDVRRQMPAPDGENGVDVLEVARIEVFQHRLQPAGPDVGTNVEQSQPRKTNSGQAS